MVVSSKVREQDLYAKIKAGEVQRLRKRGLRFTTGGVPVVDFVRLISSLRRYDLWM